MKADRWFHCYDGSRELFLRESMRHPAKMAVNLCFRIFEHGEKKGYWKKGDVILDPMAGIFTTGICGAATGYRVIGVELEKHFVDLAEKNIQFAEPRFHILGDCTILQGDARRLSQVLRPSGVISSPPYVDAGLPSRVGFEVRALARAGRIDEAVKRLKEIEQKQIDGGKKFGISSDKVLREEILQAVEREDGGYAGAVGSPPYADQAITAQGHFKSRREPNEKEARRHRDEGYSAAVTSQPYLMPEGGGKGLASTAKRFEHGLAHRQYVPEQFSKTGFQIGNLRDPKDDIDAVLSSPPWCKQGAQQIYDKGKGFHSHGPNEPKDRMKKDYVRGSTPGQIGNLKDAAITSPPYADQMSAARARGRGPKSNKFIAEKRIEHNKMGDGPKQIANLHDQTYLGAMLQVYRELQKVLKVGGVVVLVTKNPVKKGQIRRLDLDTIRLMKAAGFILIERKMAMLTEEVHHGHLFGGAEIKKHEKKSFFKRLFERKRPDLAVDHEDVLIFRKR